MVYVFLANGFEETEAITVIDLLKRAEIPVKTVGLGSKLIKGAHDITVMADIIDSEVNESAIEMVVLPGGMPGTLNLEKSETVRKSIEYAAKNDKYIAAICAAPSILGDMGLLRGKDAVCYPGYEDRLIGANIKDSDVCVDGRIITSRSMGTAIRFGCKLVELLKGKERADKICSLIK